MKFQIGELVNEIKLVFENETVSLTSLINVIIDFINALLRNEEF